MYFFHFQLLKKYKGFEKWYNSRAAARKNAGGCEP